MKILWVLTLCKTLDAPMSAWSTVLFTFRSTISAFRLSCTEKILFKRNARKTWILGKQRVFPKKKMLYINWIFNVTLTKDTYLQIFGRKYRYRKRKLEEDMECVDHGHGGASRRWCARVTFAAIAIAIVVRILVLVRSDGRLGATPLHCDAVFLQRWKERFGSIVAHVRNRWVIQIVVASTD